jgi:mannosyltransferase OCH1-like enzyme
VVRHVAAIGKACKMRSMKYDIPFAQGMFVYSSSVAEKWDLLQELYRKNYIDAQPSELPRIPKIIHQIWLGSPLPEEYIELQNTWKKCHPDWEYHLWTDENVDDIKMINKEVFDKTKNLGARSDILRYELLYQFGGLYVDTDFECLKSFDDLHHLCDLYAGVLASSSLCILIGLIGAKPQSAVIKNVIDHIHLASKKQSTNEIFSATGPHHFTRCVFESVGKTSEKCVIFPATFFYPSPNGNAGVGHEIQKKYVKSESYAIHYWHISWVKSARLSCMVKKVIKYMVPYGLVNLYTKRTQKQNL